MIAVPAGLAEATVGREGAVGAAWIDALPGIVADLLDRWGCEPDGEPLHGGVGLVLPVRRVAGRPSAPAPGGFGGRPGAPAPCRDRAAVLKVSFPHPGNVHEPDAFVAWAGRGAVRLHERDDERFAMLLERARPSQLAELDCDDEVAAVAGRLNRRLAVPGPAGLPRLQAEAPAWEEELAGAVGLLPRPVLEAAVATVRELGRDQPSLLVHGDLNARNILRADREPWLAVDPKGCVGDPAYDGGTLLKSRALQLLESDDLCAAVYRFLDVFAEAAELDRARVRRWAQLHAVQASIWGRRQGFRLARSGPRLDWLTSLADRLAGLLTEGS